MKGVFPRIAVPCPNCRQVLTFSEGKFKRYGDFEIGCPHCKQIVSARNAVSKLTRTAGAADGSVP